MNKRLYFKSEPNKYITYRYTQDYDLKLHIFEPDDDRKNKLLSAIVYFHGGGWVDGTPKQFYRQCGYFSSRGMVAISCEYRIKSEHNSTPIDSIKDAKSAIRYIKKYSEELGIDPSKIVAGGSSVGAHLVASLATNNVNNDEDDLSISSIVNAMVLNVPVIDNSKNGFAYRRVKEYGKNFSPIDNLNSTVPITLIFSSENDEKIDKYFSEKYINILNGLNGGGK